MSSFAADIENGLSASPKFILPKYFYDDKGSKLFKSITAVEEYYPTRCEQEILSIHKSSFLKIIQHYHKKFDLVELGSGDGQKTKTLINHFLAHSVNFKYIPVDICNEENERLKKDLAAKFPNLKVKPVAGDFIECLSELKRSRSGKVILFLGSTIGNLPEKECRKFLKSLRKSMKKNDMLLLGFDLKKHPRLIADAYNDSKGLTRDFNLNLLQRINRELDGNFDPQSFEHFPSYDPASGKAKSFLVSKTSQKVFIGKLQKEFSFDAGEVIFTEMSRKFSIQDIEDLSEACGFKIKEHFIDSRNFFADSLWIKK